MFQMSLCLAMDGLLPRSLKIAFDCLLHVQGVCKYLSAMTSFKWASKAGSRGNSSSGSSEDNSSGGSWAAACEELRQSMRASRGKQMLELVETLGGKPVSLKVGWRTRPGWAIQGTAPRAEQLRIDAGCIAATNRKGIL